MITVKDFTDLIGPAATGGRQIRLTVFKVHFWALTLKLTIVPSTSTNTNMLVSKPA